MNTLTLLGLALGVGFVSGLRLYATVFAVGLALRMEWLDLHPEWQGLALLGHGGVLGIAGGLLLIEALADKIPWIDSIWDVVHTLIRPVGAALLATGAIGNLDAPAEFMAVLLAGGVALTTHASKSGVRLLVNHSPEPASNIAASVVEDGVALGAIWLLLSNPLVLAAVVLLFLLIAAWVLPKVWRLLCASARTARGMWSWLSRPSRDSVNAS